MEEGQETEEFWQLWNLSGNREEAIGFNPDWDNWFLKLD